ncbi:hypothetical protein [Phenylobacterium sp.]|uniref:hypothetical protein n=1 Tax=Phenylobacterium sp. TaxID=1871053 RepID=UPI0027339F5A|nr:hypothetical protein [Phenylobacterium sp.]MDP3660242.1 hypothetical protein [Phenylobacterium sp.]
MTAILYPVAANGEAALAAPRGRAARESQARSLAGRDVAFVSEAVGPAFATREAALGAYAPRLEDATPGLAAEDRFCRLAETVAPAQRAELAPVSPANSDGRRWPAARPAPRTVWRLQVSYWRIAGDRVAEAPQARRARRSGEASALPPETLRAMADQPLRPFKPQQALDIGLFEVRLPEAPHIVVPDE